jgi:hypothetical protein
MSCREFLNYLALTTLLFSSCVTGIRGAVSLPLAYVLQGFIVKKALVQG